MVKVGRGRRQIKCYKLIVSEVFVEGMEIVIGFSSTIVVQVSCTCVWSSFVQLINRYFN